MRARFGLLFVPLLLAGCSPTVVNPPRPPFPSSVSTLAANSAGATTAGDPNTEVSPAETAGDPGAEVTPADTAGDPGAEVTPPDTAGDTGAQVAPAATDPATAAGADLAALATQFGCEGFAAQPAAPNTTSYGTCNLGGTEVQLYGFASPELSAAFLDSVQGSGITADQMVAGDGYLIAPKDLSQLPTIAAAVGGAG
jgi:hypothetical protein